MINDETLSIIRTELGNNTQPIFVAKNSRVNGEFLGLLESAFQEQIIPITRQRKKISAMPIFEARNIDIAKLVLRKNGVGFTTLEKLFEWSLSEGYNPPAKINDDLNITLLGTGRCTVEIACNPTRIDLINSFESAGIKGLRTIIRDTDTILTSDLPGLAKYYIPEAKIDKLDGGIEQLTDKNESPLIVGIVGTGKSMDEEGWLRLSTIGKYARQAILLRSQTCLIRKRPTQ